TVTIFQFSSTNLFDLLFMSHTLHYLMHNLSSCHKMDGRVPLTKYRQPVIYLHHFEVYLKISLFFNAYSWHQYHWFSSCAMVNNPRRDDDVEKIDKKKIYLTKS
ncbi:hypothetical protein OTU49_000199, partial [Cherax quadricarinatus]